MDRSDKGEEITRRGVLGGAVAVALTAAAVVAGSPGRAVASEPEEIACGH